ncbi:MAG: hypothetical protein ACP5N3_01565 [Candidatus Nanoarchaeia archaeon]
MVEITDLIPRKEATMIEVPKAKPLILGVPGMERIVYDKIMIPDGLNRSFLERCGVEVQRSLNGLSTEEVREIILDKNLETDLFVRYAGNKPLSIVTKKFSPIDPVSLVNEASAILGTTPTIRYFQGDESLHLNFPLKTDRFEGINVMISTGPYGLYGGSGQNALTYGISWYNKTCSNWTIFLNKALKENTGRVIHTNQGKSLAEKLNSLADFTRIIPSRIEESKRKIFSYEEMDNYFSMYEARGLNKGITKAIREENPAGITSYDLSYRLTQLCQDPKLADSSRARIEYLAGEVILCYDSIKGKLSGASDQGRARTAGSQRGRREITGLQYLTQPASYVRLN